MKYRTQISQQNPSSLTQMRTWSRLTGVLALATYTAAILFIPDELSMRQNSNLSVLVGEGFPLERDSSAAAHFFARATSSGCEEGWLCDPTPCADTSQCGSGKTCLDFGSQSICVDSGPTWCAYNPSTRALGGCGDSNFQCWYVNRSRLFHFQAIKSQILILLQPWSLYPERLHLLRYPRHRVRTSCHY